MPEPVKKCTRCKEAKLLTEFHKDKRRKDGLRSDCKVCVAVCSKKWREANPEYGEQHREANPEYFKKYYDAHAEEIKERVRQWNEDNPGKSIARSKKFREDNPKANKKYTEDNIEKINENRRKRFGEKLASDPVFRLCHNLRGRLSKVLGRKQKSGSAVRDLGCTGQYLADYLESLWTEGMSWDNYGGQDGDWSIDHIMPMAAFNLEDRQHFLLANHYLNLQPMWHRENISKGDKIPWELTKAA